MTETGIVADTKQQIKPEARAEIEKYKKVLEENPGSRMFAALADAYRKAGDLEAAVRTAEEGVKKHPKYMSGLVVLGQAYQAKQEFQKAVDLFKQVTRMNPENVPAQKALAQIFDREGNHEEATRAYRVVTILDPTDTQARKRLDILEATSPEEIQRGKLGEDKTRQEEPPAGPEPEEAAEAVESVDDAADAATEGDAREGEVEDPWPREVVEVSPKAGMPTMDQADAGALLEDRTRPETGEPDSENKEVEAPGKGKIPPPPLSGPAFEAAGPEESAEAKVTGAGKEQDEQEPAKKLSEEEMLDHFFGGGDLNELGIAEKAEGYVVANVSDAIPEGPEKGGGENSLEIKAGKMASIFWNQGFREKALSVMAHEMLADPDNRMLAKEFKAAAQAEGEDPEKLLRRARDEMLKRNEESVEKQIPGVGGGDQLQDADPNADTDPGRGHEHYLEPGEEDGAGDMQQSAVPRQGMGALKSYVNRIKQDKES